MPVPSAIADLSTTPGLNFPAGTESPSTIDEYLRAHAAFIKQTSDAKASTADVVTLTGNQTVAGIKTFSSPIAGSVTGTAANVSGTVAIANGGTGATTAAAAFTAIKQAATESATGVVELATTAEAAAGTDTTRAVTAAGVEAHMVANALGWGQTWQNLTGSRATATTYTNTTGRPIEVKVIYTGGGVYEANFLVDGLQVQYETRPAGAWVTVGAIVPNGSTYRATSTGTYNAWAELR
jgi:Lower baseplate protein N-terminal domain